MNTRSLWLLAILVCADPAAADEPGIAHEDAEATVVYQPPLLGAPANRTGGATRGELDSALFSVLAPEHTGLTIAEQPTLYWHYPGDVPGVVEYTLTKRWAESPVLTFRTPAPGRAGIQTWDLGDHGVRLEPDLEYRWFVALVTDPERRSHDLLSGAGIQLVEPSSNQSAAMDAPAQERYRHLAAAGLWYDAFDALMTRLGEEPDNAILLADRRSLLAQVGLATRSE